MERKRGKAILINSIVGLICNIFLLFIKGIIAFVCNSQAMIADTLNSAGDIVSSILSTIGSKIASKEADEDHNLGHGKAEYIFSFLISLIILFLSVQTIKSSIKSFFYPEKYDFNIFLIIVCCTTIIIKLCLFVYTKLCAKKYKSIILDANSFDHINDCLLTAMNLVAALLGLFGFTYVDGIVGIIISIIIVKQGISLFIKSFNVLMDKTISKVEKEQILEIIKKYDQIKKINHLNISPIGYKYQVSVSIFVDGNLSTFESHEIANNLEKDLVKLEFVYLAIIHVNPIKIKNK